ncbi:MAG: N-acetylmuramoyl-L-alanine amidase [Longimicrobiales bacterium]|nr:N-acetylmuramoyl-L-alanine amidase [Longimicrobiales bacterium]
MGKRHATIGAALVGACLLAAMLGAAPIPGPAETSQPRALRVALQAGHWRADEAPRELSGLRRNGTSWEGTYEWEVNLDIARRAAEMLQSEGYQVDVLPAVVPQAYEADLFIAIHADGSADPRASGYRVASSRRDRTGKAQAVAEVLGSAYGEVTGLRRLTTTTRRMRNYYAFNYRRYRHSIHPRTPGVIIETGFLTSSRDRAVIVDDPDKAALGIVSAVQAYAATQQQ